MCIFFEECCGFGILLFSNGDLSLNFVCYFVCCDLDFYKFVMDSCENLMFSLLFELVELEVEYFF